MRRVATKSLRFGPLHRRAAVLTVALAAACLSLVPIAAARRPSTGSACTKAHEAMSQAVSDIHRYGGFYVADIRNITAVEKSIDEIDKASDPTPAQQQQRADLVFQKSLLQYSEQTDLQRWNRAQRLYPEMGVTLYRRYRSCPGLINALQALYSAIGDIEHQIAGARAGTDGES
jgi:membrane-bound lytic murein transglycosylase B